MTFKQEIIKLVKELATNENYTIVTKVNEKGNTVVMYKNVNQEKYATIEIEEAKFAQEVLSLITPQTEKIEEVVTNETQSFEELMDQVENTIKEQLTVEYMEMVANLENNKHLFEGKPETAHRAMMLAGFKSDSMVVEYYLRGKDVTIRAHHEAKFFRQKDEQAIIKKTGKVLDHTLVYNFENMSFEGHVQGENGVYKARKIVAEGKTVSAHTRYIVTKQSKLTSL